MPVCDEPATDRLRTWRRGEATCDNLLHRQEVCLARIRVGWRTGSACQCTAPDAWLVRVEFQGGKALAEKEECNLSKVLTARGATCTVTVTWPASPPRGVGWDLIAGA